MKEKGGVMKAAKGEEVNSKMNFMWKDQQILRIDSGL